MANPLHIFRKYQYVFLVGFGIMLMFAFVIAPPLSDYLQSRAGTSGGGNPVVVTWTSGELRESELSNLRTQHLLTTRFLETLVRRVQVIEDTCGQPPGRTRHAHQGTQLPVGRPRHELRQCLGLSDRSGWRGGGGAADRGTSHRAQSAADFAGHQRRGVGAASDAGRKGQGGGSHHQRRGDPGLSGQPVRRFGDQADPTMPRSCGKPPADVST